MVQKLICVPRVLVQQLQFRVIKVLQNQNMKINKKMILENVRIKHV